MSEETAVPVTITVADPYNAEAAAPAEPAAPASPAEQGAHRRARAEERLALANAAVADAERAVEKERAVQARHAAFVADYDAAIAAANDELKTCDAEAVENLVARRSKAEANRQVHVERAAAHQTRIDAANADLEAAQDDAAKEQLALARIELEELDAEAIALAEEAERLIGDVFERLVAKARAAETLANAIERRRNGSDWKNVTITTAIQNIAEWTEPRGSANAVQRAGTVLAWYRDQPRQAFQLAQLNRRTEPPPPGIAAGVPASAMKNGRHPIYGVPDFRASNLPNTFAAINGTVDVPDDAAINGTGDVPDDE